MGLGERKQKILTAIIDSYIQTGEPVGSKALVEMLGNAVSSATIRNEMAELASRRSRAADRRGVPGAGREHRLRGGVHHPFRAGGGYPPD